MGRNVLDRINRRTGLWCSNQRIRQESEGPEAEKPEACREVNRHLHRTGEAAPRSVPPAGESLWTKSGDLRLYGGFGMKLGFSSRVCGLQTEKRLVDEARCGRPTHARGDRRKRTSSRNSVGEPGEGFGPHLWPTGRFHLTLLSPLIAQSSAASCPYQPASSSRLTTAFAGLGLGATKTDADANRSG